ncbi:MAG: substrate-binding domain-containing protein [Solirubrobacterales bacterium]|nr:substrate-binding domain-containing protein [Solirubrobacterales bacterium]
MKRLAAAIAASVLVLGIAACGGDDNGSGDSASDDEVTLGMANFTLAAPYFIGMDEAVKKAANEQGNVEVISTDANGDAAKLTSDVEDLVAQGVDGLIISAGPLESAPTALNSAEEAEIPVVLVDRKLADGNYTSWIGPDNEAIGLQDGEFLAEELGGQGTIAIISGGPADNTIGSARTSGMLAGIEGTDIETIKAPEFGEWSTDGGQQVMEDVLASNQDIDAVFCENDSMCLGAQKAIRDAGRQDQIILAGVDGQKEALKAILDGTNYVVTGLNDSEQIGTQGFERMMAILDGEDVEQDTVLPSPRITTENAKEHYDPNSIF